MALILFVDDDPLTLETYSTIIGYYGHDILLASTAEQAIQVAADGQPDIMVLDMNLPDMHGFDLLRKLRRNPKTAEIPAVMVSASPELFSERALEAGAQEFRSKPILPDDLLELIERYASPNA
jgi:two-component system cell cycle response regulator DivK